MLKIKEICKTKGITQAELAKEIGISASALAQSISGNPSLDRMQAIADALKVPIGDLFPNSNLTALISYGNDLYKANTVEALEHITKQIKIKEMKREEKEFRIEKPYGMMYNINNGKAEFFNREYQPLGETNAIISIYNLELREMNLSGLSEEKQREIFQVINDEKDFKIGFFYSDNTNPCNKRDKNEGLKLLKIYNDRITKLYQLLAES